MGCDVERERKRRMKAHPKVLGLDNQKTSFKKRRWESYRQNGVGGKIRLKIRGLI